MPALWETYTQKSPTQNSSEVLREQDLPAIKEESLGAGEAEKGPSLSGTA